MTLFLRPFSSLTTSSSTLSPKGVCEWLQAITAFQTSYYQLNQLRISVPTNEFRGACLSCRVDQLLERMGQELTALLDELTDTSESVSLVRHTARLRSITNQAVMVVSLLTPSAG